jgi:hypothetical protein
MSQIEKSFFSLLIERDQEFSIEQQNIQNGVLFKHWQGAVAARALPLPSRPLPIEERTVGDPANADWKASFMKGEVITILYEMYRDVRK